MSISEVEDTPPEDEVAPFVDLNPERNFADLQKMAYMLGISPRHLRRLEKSGIVRRVRAGPFAAQFPIMPNLNTWIAYKTRDRPAANEGVDLKRAELLQRRLDREGQTLIERAEALSTFDLITGAFLTAVDAVGTGATSAVPNASERVSAAILETKAELETKFRRLRRQLETGKRR